MSEPNQKPVLSYYSEEENIKYQMVPTERSPLEGFIRTCRLEVTEACEEVSRVIEIGKAHTNGTYLQLLEEENLAARAAIILGLGAAGAIMGSRRGRVRGIRRLLGAGVGAGLGARVCYPQETGDFMEAIARGELPSVGLPELPTESIVDVSVVTEYATIIITKTTDVFSVIWDGVRNMFEEITKAEPSKKELTFTSSGTGEKKVSVVEEPVTTTKDTKSTTESPALIFMTEKSLRADKKFEGDPGMSKEEDSDMYTTRG